MMGKATAPESGRNASDMDRHDCYELCVQSPRHVTMFLRALHGGDPRVLREDFSGTATISRRWILEAQRAGVVAHAVAVDLDEESLARGAREAELDGTAPWLRLVRGDVLEAPTGPSEACDVIFVGNFSIGYIHQRSTLVEYLRHSRERLLQGAGGWGGGIFVCDIYDSPGKFELGALKRSHTSRGREIVHYTWEHRDADALTAMVTNAIHFRVELDGEIVSELTDAFVYRWRLWSIAELREALLEAGFASSEVHADVNEHPAPIEHGRELGKSGIVCVVGRT